jgi:hypothetical protein
MKFETVSEKIQWKRPRVVAAFPVDLQRQEQ